MTNQSERFKRLSDLFDELVHLEGEERERAILDGCGGDDQMVRELRALLSADESGAPDGLLSGMVAAEAGALQNPDMQGRQLGSWRILETIGEGGMGTVYLAERGDGAYEAKAALKLVRGGIPSPLLTERFRVERQILAGLSHPGVAQLLDGGSTEDGTPYLVMEFVDGQPITDWCAEQGLDVPQRLELFLRVCDAVAYAHQALVAHRDIKPSNILVTRDGEPKLLDFGIAKLMDTVGDDDGVTQSYGIMTPAYASPEQVSGGRAGVAADTYSLGVLLYEMLSGRLPIETSGLTPVQLISRVTRDVPAVVSSAVDEAHTKKRLSGDLDAILSRALRKEPEARYASVRALADDIRLHLDGLPIRARHDDWRYRTGKLVRRNRGVVSGSLLLVLLGISFTVNAVVQARAVARERDRAEAQRAAAEQVSGFLEELFTEADPNAQSASDITAREILDRGAARVFEGISDDPDTQAALAMVIGRVYRGLGEYDAAGPLLDSALAVRTRTRAVEAIDLGDAYIERGALAYDLGEYEQAAELHRSAIDAYRDGSAGDATEVASAMDWVSASLMELGDMDEAVVLARDAVAMQRRIDPEANADLATFLKSLTDVLRGRGELEEALIVGAEALEMSRQVYGDEHLEVAHALNQHASTLTRAGRPAEAVPLVEEGLAIRRAAFDGPHVEIGASLGNLANILVGLGRMDEALVQRQASTDMLNEIFPDDHPYVAAGTNSLGNLLVSMGRYEEAEPVLLRALASHRLVFPPAHPNLGFPLTGLGRIYRQVGRLEEAEAVLREGYEARLGGLPDRHWYIAASGLDLARTLDDMGRESEAETLFVEAYDILSETFAADDERVAQARDALREHLERRGLTERASALGG